MDNKSEQKGCLYISVILLSTGLLFLAGAIVQLVLGNDLVSGIVMIVCSVGIILAGLLAVLLSSSDRKKYRQLQDRGEWILCTVTGSESENSRRGPKRYILKCSYKSPERNGIKYHFESSSLDYNPKVILQEFKIKEVMVRWLPDDPEIYEVSLAELDKRHEEWEKTNQEV